MTNEITGDIEKCKSPDSIVANVTTDRKERKAPAVGERRERLRRYQQTNRWSAPLPGALPWALGINHRGPAVASHYVKAWRVAQQEYFAYRLWMDKGWVHNGVQEIVDPGPKLC